MSNSKRPCRNVVLLKDEDGNEIREYHEELCAYDKCGKEDTFLIVSQMGFYVAPKYKSAKDAFCHSGADSKKIGNIFQLGGMVNAHMPATYYLVAVDSRSKLEIEYWELYKGQHDFDGINQWISLYFYRGIFV